MIDDTEITKRLSHPGVAEYYTGNGHRIAAFRALLDLLSIPHPAWAARGMSGSGATRRNTMTAYHADNPQPRLTTLPARKDNAPPERVLAAKAATEARCNPSLFNQTFSQ
ncbi:hypothetical protein [Sphingorhabdus sp. EL138]|uniref:hypothetical protein n=1 Tax=Sphingorhabdus sp. EL138 TaxID=2073156 RepID=UPI000D6928D8|nr:hypothetical protein [Sphingorhabdus sp. EL138]